MPKLLISACLCGIACRYDGKASLMPELAELVNAGTAIAICPEVTGGLSTPRLPCELLGGKAINSNGVDCTKQFVAGAEQALELAQTHGIKAAILKEKSPSCGLEYIYDGTFTRTLIKGHGITAALFLQNGITVASNNNYHALLPEFFIKSV